MFFFLFLKDTATTELYTYCHTLSLHDALPISQHHVAAVASALAMRTSCPNKDRDHISGFTRGAKPSRKNASTPADTCRAMRVIGPKARVKVSAPPSNSSLCMPGSKTGQASSS